MDGQNGNPALPEDADASPPAEVDGKREFEDRLLGTRFSGWRGWSLLQSLSQQAKSATAVLMAVLLLGLGAGGYYWYQDAQAKKHQQQLRRTAQQFGDPLYWPANKIRTLDCEFHLVTKWVPHRNAEGTITHENGEMKYKLRVDGYPDVLRNSWSSEFSSSHFITVHLLDGDNFRITSLQITLDKMVRTLNPRGEAIGLSVQGTKAMPLWKYRQISDWKIAWNL